MSWPYQSVSLKILSICRLPLDMAVRGTGEPETLSYDVELNKDSALGLGITVAGYVCEQGRSER